MGRRRLIGIVLCCVDRMGIVSSPSRTPRTLAEDDVAAVEPGAGDRGDEELGAVGVGAGVGHGEEAGGRVPG